jgi:xanthine dehydrogenase accessory factor
MHWITAVAELRRERQPGVLVTVMAVRRHARGRRARRWWSVSGSAGARSAGATSKVTAVRRARELLASQACEPETETTDLTGRAPARYGVQCCGGEVTLLYEPLRPVPAVAIFGMGHIGSSWPVLAATTSSCTWWTRGPRRSTRSGSRRPPPMPWPGCTATAVVPELVLGELPAGSHV